MEVRPAEQRRGALEVEVIRNEHQTADMEVLVDRSCRIREHDTLHAEAVHETNACRDLRSAQTFIQMPAALRDEDRPVVITRQNKPSRMPRHRGSTQTGHLGIRHLAFDPKRLRHTSKTRTKHDGRFGAGILNLGE
jgi:predicted GIY-YIG superfamily endonuclease